MPRRRSQKPTPEEIAAAERSARVPVPANRSGQLATLDPLAAMKAKCWRIIEEELRSFVPPKYDGRAKVKRLPAVYLESLAGEPPRGDYPDEYAHFRARFYRFAALHEASGLQDALELRALGDLFVTVQPKCMTEDA